MPKKLRNYLAKNRKNLVLGALCLGLGGTPAAAGAATIWFAPRNPPVFTAPDFMNLFQSGAAWTTAAAQVKIFKLYPEFVTTATDANMQTIITWLKQRNIALALEYGLMNPNDAALCGSTPQCGQGGEGFNATTLGPALARIQRLGGVVQYLAMDEPLWFGHVSTQPGAPQASLAAIAQDVAQQIVTLHSYFPSAQVGDIEPMLCYGSPGGSTSWNQEIMQWAAAYQAAVGKPLAFFHSDVDWQGSGCGQQLSALQALLQPSGIAFGIIYDGNFSDSAVQWTTDAELNFAGIESNPKAVPAHAVLQSWHPQPVYALPETQSGTMTYLIDRYAAAEAVISTADSGTTITATLASNGTPVSGVPITAYAVDDGTLNITMTQSLTGTVPSGAVTASGELRINGECDCDGSANVLIGTAQYVDQKNNTTTSFNIVPPTQRIVVPANQVKSVNSAPFSVTAGDTFSFSVPMQASYSSTNTGYVAIGFFNSAGAEIQRWRLLFKPGVKLIRTSTTTSKGQMAVTPKPSITLFSFLGNAKYRQSSTTGF